MEDIWVKLYDRDGPLGHKRPASTLLFVFLRGATLLTAILYFWGGFSIHCHSADEEGVPALPGPLMARGQNNRRPAR